LAVGPRTVGVVAGRPVFTAVGKNLREKTVLEDPRGTRVPRGRELKGTPSRRGTKDLCHSRRKEGDTAVFTV